MQRWNLDDLARVVTWDSVFMMVEYQLMHVDAPASVFVESTVETLRHMWGTKADRFTVRMTISIVSPSFSCWLRDKWSAGSVTIGMLLCGMCVDKDRTVRLAVELVVDFYVKLLWRVGSVERLAAMQRAGWSPAVQHLAPALELNECNQHKMSVKERQRQLVLAFHAGWGGSSPTEESEGGARVRAGKGEQQQKENEEEEEGQGQSQSDWGGSSMDVSRGSQTTEGVRSPAPKRVSTMQQGLKSPDYKS